MRPLMQRPTRGLDLRGGKRLLGGFLRAARNSRYIVGDNRSRLWALLGRKRYNVNGFPEPADKATDWDTNRTLFTYQGTNSRLWIHRGGSIYESVMGETGSFVEQYAFETGVATPRGIPVEYAGKVYYPIGADGWSDHKDFLTRDYQGWHIGGFRTPTATFTLAEQAGSGISSTTAVRYTYRIYDGRLDAESAHGPVVEMDAFTDSGSVRVRFAAGISLDASFPERGTHVRIYRTLLDEEPGVYYRVDGAGDGIALATAGAVPYDFNDTATNTTAQLQGTVRADGLEGTDSWAEHGGAPPQARGAIEFQNHIVCFGCYGRETDLIYSAQGYPESFPVDFEDVYQYYMQVASDVVGAIVVGGYIIVGCANKIYRIAELPTYAFPGFSRIVQNEMTDQHGFAGPYAVCGFGLAQEGSDIEAEAKYAIYVSREHGPHITDGITTRPIVQQADWLNLINKKYAGNTVCTNYPTMQEVHVAYTPAGGTKNTKALILDYSGLVIGNESGYAPMIRLTGPVDVQMDMAVYGWDDDGEPRLYLAAADDPYIYVQDSGDTDEQQNTNIAGDIVLEWEFGRNSPRGHNRLTRFSRAMVEGSSGVEREFVARTYHQNGVNEYAEHNKVSIGPGADTIDSYLVNANGQSARARLEYTGPTGSNYDEDSADCAPGIASHEYEIDAGGRAGRARDVTVGGVPQ